MSKAPIPLKPLKDAAAWDAWVKANDDPYGGACIKVARRVMEILDEGQPFDCHKTICQADDETDAGGITGFMAGAVASMVSKCHSRGEEFRRAWNGENALKPEHAEAANAKEDAVINPAILTIG